jgi:hypothetical protein
MREDRLAASVFERQILPRLLFEGDCWLWTGARRGGERLGGRRYGVIQVRPHGVFYVHRVVYHLLVGALEEGDEVDHRHECRLGLCVNPRFLHAVTKEENQRRARALAGVAHLNGELTEMIF